jgi:REP element-mobilizing transposase RayT
LALEQSRIRYDFCVVGYVVMFEHVHLLMSEPERGTLASAVQAIKQSVSRKLIAGREGSSGLSAEKPRPTAKKGGRTGHPG